MMIGPESNVSFVWGPFAQVQNVFVQIPFLLDLPAVHGRDARKSHQPVILRPMGQHLPRALASSAVGDLLRECEDPCE